MKTYEQKKYKRKLTLGQYLYKEILDLSWSSRGELWQKLDSDTLEMWIQQYKIKEGLEVQTLLISQWWFLEWH